MRHGWLVVAMALWAGAASTQPAKPVVALHPVELQLEIERPEAIQALLEAALTEHLTAAGFQVVSARESGSIWKRLVDSVQGFYDPISGDTVATEYETVHRGTLRELTSRFGATHWLRPTVEVVLADWERGKAHWDGASEGVAPLGQGRVTALTLVAVVEDSTGVPRFAGRGGLQVLSKVKGERYQAVAREKLFADRKRIAKAVALSLAGFAGGAPP